MLKLMKTRRAVAMTAAGLALATGTAIGTAGTAFANGGNWAAQIGPTGQGCYAWSNWTSNHVTGHIYSQNGDSCTIGIFQWWRSSGSPTGSENDTTTGSGTVASAPNNSPYFYYYYGPAGNNDYLCVEVVGSGFYGTAWHVYGTGC